MILVTGGSRGVGAATARLAAGRGCDAISHVSNETAAHAVVADVEAAGRRAPAVRADSADAARPRHLLAAIGREFGGLEVPVNNAAILSLQSRLEDLDPERIRRIFAVNSIGPELCARQAVRRMSTRRRRDRRQTRRSVPRSGAGLA